jgi:hypothetical protein
LYVAAKYHVSCLLSVVIKPWVIQHDAFHLLHLQEAADIFDIVPLVAAPIAQLIETPLYFLAEAIVLLGMLALVDAGYSGDWSRIGVIDKDMEPMLQRLAQVLDISVWLAVVRNKRDC